jgi:pimeloyl-ACP methyl ester carboxylesterase
MQIDWKESRLFFEKSGSGPEPLLLFHGFGQDHTHFNSLMEKLDGRYTCYAFDLYYHGASHWTEPERPLEKTEWNTIMAKFLDHERITTFSILGFSIGARLVLSTFMAYTDRVKEIFLIAPDGIYSNPWFRTATSTVAGRAVFKKFGSIRKPLHFMALIAERFGLLHPGLRRLAEHQTRNTDVRNKVYRTWMLLRRLTFSIEELTNLFDNSSAQVVFVLGKHDPIIKEAAILAFVRSLKRTPTVKILEVSHHRMIKELSANPDLLTKERNDNQH